MADLNELKFSEYLEEYKHSVLTNRQNLSISDVSFISYGNKIESNGIQCT